jgi:hypothetical protein
MRDRKQVGLLQGEEINVGTIMRTIAKHDSASTAGAPQ